jgi:putative colanic acid biosynthesis acetyltransferase WcaF
MARHNPGGSGKSFRIKVPEAGALSRPALANEVQTSLWLHCYAMPKRLFTSRLSVSNLVTRKLWGLVWLFLFRPSPTPLHMWRRFLLRAFGATMERGARAYPRSRIWAPWNLHMAADSCIANGVECYSVAPIFIGAHASISQSAILCTASHDLNSSDFAMVSRPITVQAFAWVAAGAFVGPGVTIGEGAVVGATASVFRDVEPWVVMQGNPAVMVKRRSRTVSLDR